jgi:WD40 repeat protein
MSPNGRAVALAPDRRHVAFTVPKSGATFDIVLWDVQASTTRTIVRSHPGSGWGLAWKPMSNVVTFDGADGWIYTASAVDGRVSRLVEGESPAWAPDGGRLALRRGQTVYVYEIATGETRRLHTRRWWLWQSKLNAAPPSWSPDGQFVVWNGEILYDIECLFINAESGVVHRVYKGPYWCGPWLHNQQQGERLMDDDNDSVGQSLTRSEVPMSDE